LLSQLAYYLSRNSGKLVNNYLVAQGDFDGSKGTLNCFEYTYLFYLSLDNPFELGLSPELDVAHV
jgi:hypothetical protein